MKNKFQTYQVVLIAITAFLTITNIIVIAISLCK